MMIVVYNSEMMKNDKLYIETISNLAGINKQSIDIVLKNVKLIPCKELGDVVVENWEKKKYEIL